MKKRTVNFKKAIGLIGFLLLVPSLLLNLYFLQKINKFSEGTKVIGVIDGDTIVLEGKVRLRLRHIDAPELVFCGGKEAKELLEDLAVNKKVVIQEKILDQQGRAMALIYVNNKLLNEKMLESGWVRYHSDQTAVARDLKATSDKAKAEQKGVFSPKCYQVQNLDNPKCVIKANIDKSTGERIYYLPGCPQYKFTIVEKDTGERWFCSEEEAVKEGFRRAKNC